MVVTACLLVAAGAAVGDDVEKQHGAEGALAAGPEAKEQEMLVVFDPHRVVDPRAEVVQLHHAPPCNGVVVGAHGLESVAALAPSLRRPFFRVLGLSECEGGYRTSG